jgi:hypothetical protein
VIDLPNENWIRATKRPDWALCLDSNNSFYGWKMYEMNGYWVSGARLTAEEIVKAMGMPALAAHWSKLQALLAHRAKNDIV